MSITNYGELKAAIAPRVFNRTDLDTYLPDYIRQAHDKLIGEIVLSYDLTVATETVALPSDFGRVSSVWLQTYPKRPLTEATEDQMQGLGSGDPDFYRIDGANIVFGPVPSQTYAGYLAYKLARTFFANDAATNTILTRYPLVYLWGALAEAGADMLDSDVAQGYEAKFQNEISRINASEMRDLTAGPLQVSSSQSYGQAY